MYVQHGIIKREDYDRLVEEIDSTGNTYEVNIIIGYIDENPSKKTSSDMTDDIKIGENIYYLEFTTQIENKFDETEDGVIKLQEGYYIQIDVENVNPTIHQIVQNALYGISGGRVGKISGTHSALVIGNTNGKLASNVPEGITYTITYDANGGIQNTCPYPEKGYKQVKTSGRDIALSSVSPRHSNDLYKFSGWAETPDATVAKYFPRRNL